MDTTGEVQKGVVGGQRSAEVVWMVLRTGLGGGSEMWRNCSCRTLYHVGVDVPIVLLDSLG